MKKPIRLRKVNDNIFCDVYFEKPEPEKKKEGKPKAFDIGYKKLLVDENGNKYGQDFEEL